MNGDIKQPIFGNWYIDEEIGSGAFGTVYRIKRESFGNVYYSALKVIKIPQSQSEIRSMRSEFDDDRSLSDYYSNFVQDFAKEIEVMAELKGNSNIVSFEDHDFIRNEDGIGWTVLIRMELLTPFVDFQRENKIENYDVVKLGIDICSALEICEKRNIIHRDIKPDNIFLSKDGDYELGDFGIAREIEKTMGGLSKKGTYSYMAPEVYLGKAYNSTVDIYSLGIVMYKLLNYNRAPFMPEYPNPITFTDREAALQKRMKGEEVPDITEIPKVLNDIVKKACAFDPKDRYQSASELKQALIDSVEADAPTVFISKTVSKNNEEDDKTVSPFGDVKKETDKEDDKTVGPFGDVKEETDKEDDKTVGPLDKDDIESKDESGKTDGEKNAKKLLTSKKFWIPIGVIVLLAVIISATLTNSYLVSKNNANNYETQNLNLSTQFDDNAVNINQYDDKNEKFDETNSLKIVDKSNNNTYNITLPISYNQLKNTIKIPNSEFIKECENEIIEPDSGYGFYIYDGLDVEVLNNGSSSEKAKNLMVDGFQVKSGFEINGLKIGMDKSKAENLMSSFGAEDVSEHDDPYNRTYTNAFTQYWITYDQNNKVDFFGVYSL